jgi:hypothetical protein
MKKLNKYIRKITEESLKTSDIIDLSKEVKNVKDVRSLPIELKEIVQRFLNMYDVHQGDCHFNSLKLSIFNPKITRVFGFVGYKFSENEINFLNTNPKLIKLPNGLFQFNPTIGESKSIKYFDLENKIIYYKHSWSKYEGIHFDITTFCEDEMMSYKSTLDFKVGSKFTKEFRYYYEISQLDLRKIKYKGFDTLQILKYVVGNYPMEGIIMNRLKFIPLKNSFISSSCVPNRIMV